MQAQLVLIIHGNISKLMNTFLLAFQTAHQMELQDTFMNISHSIVSTQSLGLPRWDEVLRIWQRVSHRVFLLQAEALASGLPLSK